jgi:hypothetical protein
MAKTHRCLAMSTGFWLAPLGQSDHWLPVRAASDRKQKSGLSAV